MSMQPLNMEFNTFVGGLLTEANPINYPVGYTLDEQNFILERNGTRRRRPGTTFEATAQDFDDIIDANFSDTSYEYKGFYYWKDASKNANNTDILVLYYLGKDNLNRVVNSHLAFFDAGAASISSAYLGKYTVQPLSGLPDGTVLSSISSFNNHLVIAATTSAFVGPAMPCISVLTYEAPGTFSRKIYKVITVRDLHGTAYTSVTTRPSSTTENHTYNLKVRGWTTAQIASFYTAAGSLYPALSDNPNYGNTVLSGFDPAQVLNALPGSTDAARGAILTNPWDITYDGYSTHSGGTSPDLPGSYVGDTGTVVDMTTFGGRLLYLCDASSYPRNGSAFLAYSQVGDIENCYKCYQENDPTSDLAPDLLDSDGGVINLSDIGTPLRTPTGRSRQLIFGSEGVFELVSANDVFTPLSIGVRKVTNNSSMHTYETISSYSYIVPGYLTTRKLICNNIITVGDTFYYFSDAGIIKLAVDPNLGQYVEENLSANRIQTLYTEIPEDSRKTAKGVYLPEENIIMWFYASTPGHYDNALVYDIILGSFSKFKYFRDPIRGIQDIFVLPSSMQAYNTSDILKRLRFIAETPSKGTTIFYHTTDHFVDWNTVNAPGGIIQDGGSTHAFMQTGYINGGDSQRMKQCQYIIPSFLRTEDGFYDDGTGNLIALKPSGCEITAYWDFADTTTYNSLNPPFEAYRYNREYIPSGGSDLFKYGQSVITTKNRLTGRGRGLSLRFSASNGDCRLLGWGLGFESNTKV